MGLEHIEPWWKRIGCTRALQANTGEEAAMCDEIRDLRDELAAAEDAASSAIDYKALLAKYMQLIVEMEGITFVDDIAKSDTEFSELEKAALLNMQDEVTQ